MAEGRGVRHHAHDVGGQLAGLQVKRAVGEVTWRSKHACSRTHVQSQNVGGLLVSLSHQTWLSSPLLAVRRSWHAACCCWVAGTPPSRRGAPEKGGFGVDRWIVLNLNH